MQMVYPLCAWKIGFQSALFLSMMGRESKLCVRLPLSYFIASSPSFPIIAEPVRAFSWHFSYPLPQCVRLCIHNVSIYSR